MELFLNLFIDDGLVCGEINGRVILWDDEVFEEYSKVVVIFICFGLFKWGIDDGICCDDGENVREFVLFIFFLLYFFKKNCCEEGYIVGVVKNFLFVICFFCNEEESCKCLEISIDCNNGVFKECIRIFVRFCFGIEVREICFDVSVLCFCSGYFK